MAGAWGELGLRGSVVGALESGNNRNQERRRYSRRQEEPHGGQSIKSRVSDTPFQTGQTSPRAFPRGRAPTPEAVGQGVFSK